MVALDAATHDDAPLHGEIGVLAYNAVADRIQCHACGGWYQKLETSHLRRHGLTVPSYKELYGLTMTTPLETPRITPLRRRKNLEHEGWRNLTRDHVFVARAPRETRAQFHREYYSPERQRGKALAWSDEEMVAYVRALRARLGQPLRRADLDANWPGGRAVAPSHTVLIKRLGGWRRICAILGQPYLTGRSVTSGAWANHGYAYRTLPAAYRAALRTTAPAEDGYRARLAPGVVSGVDRTPALAEGLYSHADRRHTRSWWRWRRGRRTDDVCGLSGRVLRGHSTHPCCMRRT